jgi:hypothetical protein
VIVTQHRLAIQRARRIVGLSRTAYDRVQRLRLNHPRRTARRVPTRSPLSMDVSGQLNAVALADVGRARRWQLSSAGDRPQGWGGGLADRMQRSWVPPIPRPGAAANRPAEGYRWRIVRVQSVT